MTTSSISSTADTPVTYDSTEANTLDQNEFLLLLTTELQYQDPTDPMDTYELTSQTTMFAQLEELQMINAQLDGFAQQSSGNMQVQSLAYLGTEVTAEGNSVSVAEGSVSPISFTLAEDAASVAIDIYDEEGNIVTTEELGPAAEGTHEFTWDGLATSGQPVPDGNYTVAVRATSESGDPVAVDTSTTGTVVSVSETPEGVVLTLEDGRTVNSLDVTSVSTVTESSEEGVQ